MVFNPQCPSMKLMCPPPVPHVDVIRGDQLVVTPPKQHVFMMLMEFSYPFELGVLFGMTVISLLRLARTCKFLHAKVEHHLRIRRDIRAALSLFLPVDSISSFRNLQADTGLLIGGTFAQSFIDLTLDVSKWLVANEIELDMPLFSGKSISQIISRKLSATRSSLTYVPPTQDEIRQNPDVLIDLQFKTKSGIKVHLHVCSRSALCGILSLSSTSLLNFVGTHSAFSLFPRETFNKRVSLSVNATQNNYLRTIQNPFRRWPGQLIDSFYPLDRSCDFPAGPRMFSGRDQTCLRVPLTGDDEQLSDYRDNIILESTVYFGYVLSGKGPAYLNYNTWDKYTVRPTPLLLQDVDEVSDEVSSVIVDGDDKNKSSSVVDENVAKQSSVDGAKESVMESSNLKGGYHTTTSSVPDRNLGVTDSGCV
ncbi:hypothetical protein ONZ45_g15202 [Pleurotus djamor]|nr:hypothetical protein ONZ45_g15202 [Pleurotus djamor]